MLDDMGILHQTLPGAVNGGHASFDVGTIGHFRFVVCALALGLAQSPVSFTVTIKPSMSP